MTDSSPDPFDPIAIAAGRLAGQIAPDFEVVDDPRTEEPNRVVFDWFGFLEPHVTSDDFWRSVPVRLVHGEASGWCLEVGPWSLNGHDIALLRRAIEAFDAATGARPAQAAE